MSKLRSEYVAPDFFAARVLFRQEPEEEEDDEDEDEDEDRDEDGDDSQDDDEGYSP
jgi:hypothetical protein